MGVSKNKKRNQWIGEITIKGKRHRVYGVPGAHDKGKVKAALDSLATDLRGGVAAPTTATVNDYIDDWVQRTLPNKNLAGSTIAGYEWMADCWREELGTMQVVSLRVSHIEDALDRMAAGSQGSKLGARSLTLARQTLVQILKRAVTEQDITFNPAVHAEFTPQAAKPAERRSLTADEAATLWAACGTDPLGPMWQLMLATGLRPGEAAAVKWDALDLDGDTATLKVSRSVRADKNRRLRVVDEVKTPASNRTVELSTHIVAVLRQQRLDVKEQQMAAKKWTNNQLVFPNTHGGIIDRDRQVHSLRKLCKTAGIDPVIRPHELRHTAASLLSAQGVPHQQIADLLGHDSTQMLDRVYRHRLRAVQSAAVNLDFGNQQQSG
jgi:integrase